MDMLMKRKKAAGPKTKIENAIDQRRKQGRGPLDHWDMFANVMATRNSLDPSHPNHLSLQQVTEATAKEVHQMTNLPLPDVFAVSNEDAHASTGGGYRVHSNGSVSNKPITLTMMQPYGQKALNQIKDNENTDAFRKVVRTISHEMTHVKQRKSLVTMASTDSPMREMEAYGNELVSHPNLPSLQGPEFNKTVAKFQREKNKITANRHLTVPENELDHQVSMRVRIGKGIGK